MNDYISRQAAVEAVEGLDWYCVFYGRIIQGAKDTKTALYKAEDVYEVLAKLPAADAVEVVRCKDCRHFGANDFPYTLCHRIAEAVEWNDYCSYGEQKA